MKIPIIALSSVLWLSVYVSAGPQAPDASAFSPDITQALEAPETQIPAPAAIREPITLDAAANLTTEELRAVENANRALTLALAGRHDRFGLMPETPLSREYAILASAVDHKGSLDILLKVMTGVCLNNPGFKQAPKTHVQAMMRGLMSYLSGGGAAIEFQGRHDLTLHFTYAAYLDMAYGYTLARYAALRKEQQDSQQDGNACDYDDYAASMLGASWADKNAPELAAWLNKWETGERKLYDIPALQFGREPHGVGPQSQKLREVDAFAANLMR